MMPKLHLLPINNIRMRNFWVAIFFLPFICSPAFAFPTPRDVDLPPFYVKHAQGQFIQGGLVILHLQPQTGVFLDGIAIPVLDDIAILGFGRDAPEAIELGFKRLKQQHSAHIFLRARTYDIQRINGLPPKFVTPPPEDLPRIKTEGTLKRQALDTFTPHSWFLDGFTWPVTGKITGIYGSQRFYNNEPRRPHYGIDIAAPLSTAIRAPASGRVSLAQEDMYFEGGLIFIDHGMQLSTAYLHLNDIYVKAGDHVKAGDIIGTVGSKGRSTGAHLDWRAYWNGRRLDPALLVAPFTPAKRGD